MHFFLPKVLKIFSIDLNSSNLIWVHSFKYSYSLLFTKMQMIVSRCDPRTQIIT